MLRPILVGLCACTLSQPLGANGIECPIDPDDADIARIHLALTTDDFDCFEKLVRTPEEANATHKVIPIAARASWRMNRVAPRFFAHLISSGLDPNLTWTNHHASSSILGWAIRQHNTTAVALLLEAGADVEAVDGRFSKPWPLLLTAVQNKNANIVRLLIEKGADVNRVRPADGLTPVLLAASIKDPSIMSLLIASGGDVEASRRNPYESWPLWIAAGKGNEPLVRLLIEAGANVNRQSTDNGYTALHKAIHSRDERTIKTLVNAGAITTTETNHGTTPMAIATRLGLEHLLEKDR